MAATINNFITALLFPDQYLKNLVTLTPQLDEQRLPIVKRTKYFADATIEWNSHSYLLSLPLSPEGIAMAQNSSIKLRQLSSKFLLEYRVLPSELCCLNGAGAAHYTDLLLEELPANSIPLQQAIEELTAERLLAAVARLQSELSRLGITHSNLKIENLMIDSDDNLYPLRLHYASFEGANDAEFDELRSSLCGLLGVDVPCVDHSMLPESQNAIYGYQSVGNPFEGMCVAECSAGYGYIDPKGKELIAPQYIWAGDMHEGRAEVETSTGMGLIDAQGNYILEPHYEIVEFDIETTHIRARKDGQWLLFDYEGQLLNAEDIKATK